MPEVAGTAVQRKSRFGLLLLANDADNLKDRLAEGAPNPTKPVKKGLRWRQAKMMRSGGIRVKPAIAIHHAPQNASRRQNFLVAIHRVLPAFPFVR
ncbi:MULTISPECIES: hypothetical protein [unclassified Sphingobium]